jgi:hypothetical protein
MSLLNKKSLLDLVPGDSPQTSNPQTGELNPVPQDEMVGHYDSMKPSFFALGPESTIKGERDTLHEKSLEDIYTSPTNPLSSYGAGQPGGIWPTLSPSRFDLNGKTPDKYNDIPRK